MPNSKSNLGMHCATFAMFTAFASVAILVGKEAAATFAMSADFPVAAV
jgi:hypothetical protein